MITNRDRSPRHPGWWVGMLAALAIAAAACSGSNGPGVAGAGSSSAPKSSPSAGADPVAYTRCMRTHGIPNFPDPAGDGTVPKLSPQELGVSSTQLDGAQRACAHLLPANGGHPTRQQQLSVFAQFTGCMRSNGFPGWPYPNADSSGWPIFYLQNQIDAYARQTVSAIRSCRDRMPATFPQDLPESVFPGGVRICPGDRPGDWRNGDDCNSWRQ